MPADYTKIREENIARYGWDTAVLDLLGQLYSERTHFIFELIQNAEDADATEVAFELFEDRLELRHDGRPFTEADVRGVCGVGKSAKAGDLTAIGKFGIGFKSVYAYTRSPRIHSSAEHFRIENYVRPVAVEALPFAGTLFVFPFDHDTVPAADAVREIAAALSALQPRVLLFLENVERLRVRGGGVAESVIERSVAEEGTKRRVTLRRGRRREEWLVWSRLAEGLGRPAAPVEIAFRVEGGHIVPCDSSPLIVFFPTEKETFLGFLVQGPYRTTPARDNIPEHDPSNQVLVRETAALLCDVLRELRDDGLLTVEALQALPLDAARFGADSMFRPLFDAVGEALTAEALIPVAGGGYGVAVELELASGPAVHELLEPDQLGALCGAGRPVWFTEESITEHQTPALWRYLREEIGIDEVTPADLVARVTREFLQAQSDEWITRFYVFLFTDSALWRAPRFEGDESGPARAKPIIRLEDGRHVVPFASQDRPDRPTVYLPGPVASSLPTVRRAIADSPAARQFLEALNLTEPDVVAEVLELILPRYGRLDVAEFDPAQDLDFAQHDADLDCIVRALDEAAADRREELLGRLRQTAFLIGENAVGGAQRLMPPPRLYQRSKELEVYFDGNLDIWFAGDCYGPWLVQLRGMGVRQAVEVRQDTEPARVRGITVDFGRNERGLDGFDPTRRSTAWTSRCATLATPVRSTSGTSCSRRTACRVRGGGRSVLALFSDSSQENVRSAIAEAAEREAGCQGGTGPSAACLALPRRPAADVRAGRRASPGAADAPARGGAGRRQLGIPPEVLWG